MTNAELRAMYPDAKSLKECIGRYAQACRIGRITHSENCAVNRVLGIPNPGSGKSRKWNKKRATVPGDNPEQINRRKSRLPTPAANSIFNIGSDK